MIGKWLPVLLWAGMIFYFSTDTFSSANTSPLLKQLIAWLVPGITSPQIAMVELAVRKFGHWAEYLVLSVLLMRAFNVGRPIHSAWRSSLWTLAIVLIAAISDELHQAFVPSRTAAVADVLIDLFGGVCGVVWICRLRERRKARDQNGGDQRRDS
jgi:VanZ family protein